MFLEKETKSDNIDTLQRQFGIGTSGIQAIYFWPPALFEKYEKAQITCIPAF